MFATFLKVLAFAYVMQYLVVLNLLEVGDEVLLFGQHNGIGKFFLR